MTGCAVTHTTVPAAMHAAALRLPERPEVSKSPDVVVERTIDIDAPPAQVMAILRDVDSWTQWDKNVTEARSHAHRPLQQGDAFFQNPGGYPTEARVLDLTDARALRWKGQQPGGGGVTGVHSFQTIALPGQRTRVINREEFSRWYLRLLCWATDLGIGKQFQKTLESLKQRAESKLTPTSAGLAAGSPTVVSIQP